MSLRFGNVRLSNTGLSMGGNVRLASNGLSISNVTVSRSLVANVVSANSLSATSINANVITANTMSASNVSLSAATAFTGSYNTLSNTPILPSVADYAATASTASNLAVINRPLQSVLNQGTSVLNSKIWNAVAYTASNGTVTFYTMVNGAAGGTPIFSQILTVQGSLWQNTSTATSVPNIAGKSISADLSTIVFNVVVGSTAGIVGGGSSAVFASNGIPCMCMVIGV